MLNSKRFRKIKKGPILLMAFLFILFPMEVLADNSLNPPSGLKLTNIFRVPYPSGQVASSRILLSADKQSTLVQITPDASHKRGGIWSTDINKLNLKEDFSSSMHVYFGNKGAAAADGITFVLHNDSKEALGEVGQSLGVWRSPASIGWLEGVKKSFAVEFDTYYNSGDNNNQDFDVDISKNSLGTNHIAWNYPDSNDTYKAYGTKSAKMVHNNIQYPGWISDDQWHSFKFTWKASTTTFTYQFDKLAPVSIKITPSIIFGSQEVYWGFTGSTGSQYALNHVAFDEVPGLVNAKVDLEIQNAKTKESVINKEVKGNTRLTYRYSSEYLSGKQDWQEIKLRTTLDAKVDYVPNSLKFVDQDGIETSYPDSSWTDGNLDLLLKDMNKTANKGFLSFDVKTKKMTSKQTVTEKGEYKGSNLILRTNEKKYSINTQVEPGISQTAALKKTSQNDSEYVASLTAKADEAITFRDTVIFDNSEIGNHDYSVAVTLPQGISYQAESLIFDGKKVEEADIISQENGLLKFYLPEMSIPSTSTKEITFIGNLADNLSDQTLTTQFDMYNSQNGLISSSNEVTVTIPKVEYGKVIIYYKNQKGEEIKKARELIGEVGKEYQVEEPEKIEWYEFVDTTGDVKGIYTVKEKEVIFNYKEALGTIKIISSPEEINFGKVRINDYQQPIGISGTDLPAKLTVEDTRKIRNKWDISAEVVQELTNGNDTQSGALKYLYGGELLNLSENEQIIYSNDGKSNQAQYNISDAWQKGFEKEGLKIKVESNKVPKTTGNYAGVIQWNLRSTQY